MYVFIYNIFVKHEEVNIPFDIRSIFGCSTLALIVYDCHACIHNSKNITGRLSQGVVVQDAI